MVADVVTCPGPRSWLTSWLMAVVSSRDQVLRFRGQFVWDFCVKVRNKRVLFWLNCSKNKPWQPSEAIIVCKVGSTFLLRIPKKRADPRAWENFTSPGKILSIQTSFHFWPAALPCKVLRCDLLRRCCREELNLDLGLFVPISSQKMELEVRRAICGSVLLGPRSQVGCGTLESSDCEGDLGTLFYSLFVQKFSFEKRAMSKELWAKIK